MKNLVIESLDLAACEQEPIRNLGLVQPHGCLLAANANGLITHASENLRQFMDLDAYDALNMPLAKVLGSAHMQSIGAVDGPMRQSIWEDVAERHCVWSHGNGLRTIVEIESNPAYDPDSIDLRFEESLAAISAARSITQQAQLASELTHTTIGYDRIMIYRFLEDWCGEVIAEVRNAHATPFLGLRYPASDIPPQARQLYLENLSRVIVDVNVTPAAVLSLPTESSPLDLSHCKLRSVSPYHIDYLKNMGVGASASASIVVNGLL